MKIKLLAALAVSSCVSSATRPTARSQIDPASYGLTQSQWKRCLVDLGHGNEPDEEARWCAAHHGDLEKRDAVESARIADLQKQGAERATRAAEFERLKADPGVRTAAVSARLCAFADWRRAESEAVKREHRYSEETGVVDLRALQDLKNILRLIDDAKADQERVWTAPLQRCGDPTVGRIAACVRLQVGGGFAPVWTRAIRDESGCGAADLQPYLAVVGDAR
jgi:hypothetical protein